VQSPPDQSADYLVRQPRPSLAGIVRCVWRYRSPSRERRIEPIPPDGCPELIVNIQSPAFELDADGALHRQPAAIFAGQLTKPLTLVVDGLVETIGVRFEPDGARDFFAAPMRRAADRRIPLTQIRTIDVAALVRNLRAQDWERQSATAEDIVEAALAPGREKDPLVADAISRLAENKQIAADTLTIRQLQRRFVDRVGVSMREYRSILRFRRVFDEIEARPDWAQSALAAGYFDQAQMARDFRRYLGCTASAWARQKAGLATSLAR
jgi:AraC-like DNA-binding protein